jgi:hypothetical protein
LKGLATRLRPAAGLLLRGAVLRFRHEILHCRWINAGLSWEVPGVRGASIKPTGWQRPLAHV